MPSLDRTWCDFWRDCPNASGCDRKWTDEMARLAANLPVSHFMEAPPCHFYDKPLNYDWNRRAKEASDANDLR